MVLLTRSTMRVSAVHLCRIPSKDVQALWASANITSTLNDNTFPLPPATNYSSLEFTTEQLNRLMNRGISKDYEPFVIDPSEEFSFIP